MYNEMVQLFIMAISYINFKSFNRQVFQQVVDYLNMNQSIDQLVICGLKSAYILKHTLKHLKKIRDFIIIS